MNKLMFDKHTSGILNIRPDQKRFKMASTPRFKLGFT